MLTSCLRNVSDNFKPNNFLSHLYKRNSVLTSDFEIIFMWPAPNPINIRQHFYPNMNQYLIHNEFHWMTTRKNMKHVYFCIYMLWDGRIHQCDRWTMHDVEIPDCFVIPHIISYFHFGIQWESRYILMGYAIVSTNQWKLNSRLWTLV